MRYFLLLILLLFCHPSFAAQIEGRVIDGDQPVAGMRVAAYRSLDQSGEPLVVSDPTDEDGRYRVDVPAGYVALYAHDSEVERFAFCGRNPVHATDEQPVWAGLQLLPISATNASPYPDEYSAGLTGQVLASGQPLAGAVVYLYLDVAEDLKGQGYRRSLPTGVDGYFDFDNLPESKYFLVARKRLNGALLGPVRAGDLLGVYPGNPLNLQAGQQLQVSMSLVPKLKGSSSETPNRASSIRLTGQVIDEQGHPLAGLHVFAYRERVIGHDRPAALSAVTDADGRFVVNFAEAGIYYIGARQLYGDSPAPGELFGMYEGSADHGLQIEAGMAEIRIEVTPVDLF